MLPPLRHHNITLEVRNTAAGSHASGRADKPENASHACRLNSPGTGRRRPHGGQCRFNHDQKSAGAERRGLGLESTSGVACIFKIATSSCSSFSLSLRDSDCFFLDDGEQVAPCFLAQVIPGEVRAEHR